MTITDSYYVVYNEGDQTFLTPLMDWSEKFGRAKRITDVKEANFLLTRYRNGFNALKVLICQATIETVEI